MIKTLKNISNADQLVNTINGKQIVKAGATFETSKGVEILRNYKSLFVEVDTEKKDVVKNEKKAEEKPAKKTLKNK